MSKEKDNKTIPVWVVQEFISLSDDNMEDKIKRNVEKYLMGDFGNESEHNEYSDDLEALSRNPKEFEIEGCNATVGEVLDYVNECYNIILDINSKIDKTELSREDIKENMTMSELSQKVGQKRVKPLDDVLRKIPEPIRGHFATYHHSGMGGENNNPTIGLGGDLMKRLYQERFNN